jgi:predicted ester cyclase
MNIPATGKSIEVTGMNINRIENGKIAESWGVIDILGLLQQLGVIPAPGGEPGSV